MYPDCFHFSNCLINFWNFIWLIWDSRRVPHWDRLRCPWSPFSSVHPPLPHFLSFPSHIAVVGEQTRSLSCRVLHHVDVCVHSSCGFSWCHPTWSSSFHFLKWGKSLSRVWLFATPWTVAYHAPPSMGLSRQEYWSGLPFPSPPLFKKW